MGESMERGTSRQDAMNAARRATMVKSSFASIRHLLDGDDFMNNQSMKFDGNTSAKSISDSEDEDVFGVGETKQGRLNNIRIDEEGDESENDSINDLEVFPPGEKRNDRLEISVPAMGLEDDGDDPFFPEQSANFSKSVSHPKGLFSPEDEFGFDNANFDEGNNVKESKSGRKDRSSRRTSSSGRLRKKSDKIDQDGTTSPSEQTETTNGSSSRRSGQIPPTPTSSRKSRSKSGSGDELFTPRRSERMKISLDESSLNMTPGQRRRKSVEREIPRKSKDSTRKSDASIASGQSKKGNRTKPSRSKSDEKIDVGVDKQSLEVLQALAKQLANMTAGEEEKADDSALTGLVGKVKELKKSRSKTKDGTKRSKSRGRADFREHSTRRSSVEKKSRRSSQESRPKYNSDEDAPRHRRAGSNDDSRRRASPGRSKRKEDAINAERSSRSKASKSLSRAADDSKRRGKSMSKDDKILLALAQIVEAQLSSDSE